jgi:hypothetical protein
MKTDAGPQVGRAPGRLATCRLPSSSARVACASSGASR